MKRKPREIRFRKLQRIKDLRAAAGMSTYAVAAALGTNQSTVSGWENGMRRLYVDDAKRIAALFGVEWWTLYE